MNELVPDRGDENTLGLRIPVILIHGVHRCYPDPTPEMWDNFVEHFYNDPRDVFTSFKLYRLSWHSNEQTLYDLGGVLRDILDALDDDLDAEFRGKPLLLIAHSTGGLLARSYMQEHWSRSAHPYDGQSLPGGKRVLRLITLATPHHGSPLANKPYRDEYVHLWNETHSGLVDRLLDLLIDYPDLVEPFIHWTDFSAFVEDAQCWFERFPPWHSAPPYDQPTRSDLHWDNSIARFFSYIEPPTEPWLQPPTGDFRLDQNPWLQRLNCIYPFSRVYNPNCDENNFDAKIIAYGGKLPDLGTGDLPGFALGNCAPKLPENIKGFFLCLLQSLLDTVFELRGDGFVPLHSALYMANRTKSVRPMLKFGYDHQDMIKGRTPGSDDRLFVQVRNDLLAALPNAPAARIEMRHGSLVGTERVALRPTIPRGRLAKVSFTAEGSLAPAGSITSYEWQLAGAKVAEVMAFDHWFAAGRHEIELRVTASIGQVGTEHAWVIVQEETTPIERPSVTTHAPRAVIETAAVLSGHVIPNSANATAWFHWGYSEAYGHSTKITKLVGDSTMQFSKILASLSPGTTYHYRLVAHNAAGMSYGGNQVFTTRAQADESPPSIFIHLPTSEDRYSTGSQALTLAGTAHDNTSVVRVSWTSDRGGSGVATGMEDWTIPSVHLRAGANAITVTAWDRVGNSADDVLIVAYEPPDNISPQTAIIGGPSGVWTSSDFTFSWAGSDNVTPEDNLLFTTHLEGYDLSSTSYSTARSRSFAGVPNGSYTFWVRAQDEAGNPDFTAARRSFSVDVPDTTAPTVAGFTLSGGGRGDGSLFFTGREYGIIFVTTDNIRPVEADLYYHTAGASWTPILVGVRVATGANVFEWTVPPAAASDGTALRVIVRDAARNAAEAVLGPLVVLDGTPPTLRVGSPNGGEDWALDSVHTIHWDPSSTRPLDGFVIKLVADGTVFQLASVDGASRSYEWALPPTGFTERALIQIVAQDEHGIRSEDASDGFFRISDPDEPPLAPWHIPSVIIDGASGPAAAGDRFGNIHVVGVRREEGSVLYRRRGSGAWGSVETVAAPTLHETGATESEIPAYVESPRIATDSEGWPHVIWLSRRLVEPPQVDDDLFYSYFDGVEWGEPLNLSAELTTGNQSETINHALAVDSNGLVHVFWAERLLPDETRHHAIRSNEGWSITVAEAIETSGSPRMLADDLGNVHLVTTRGGSQIYHSTYHGTEWQARALVDNYPYSNQLPDLALATNGGLHSAWLNLETSFPPFQYSIQYSRYDGASWATPHAMRAQDSVHGIGIAVNALGQPVVAWVQLAAAPPAGLPFTYVSEIVDDVWSPATRIATRSKMPALRTEVGIARGAEGTHVVWGGSGGVIWNWADYGALFSITPEELSFPAVAVGDSAERSFFVQNATVAPVTGTVEVGVPFAVLGDREFTLAPGETQGIALSFSPTESGAVEGIVRFPTSAGENTRRVTGVGAIRPSTATDTPTPTATCAPTATPFCADECPGPCPTIRPFCPAEVCGSCIENPECGPDEVCHPDGSGPVRGCCQCATPTPTATQTSPTSGPTPLVTPIPCPGDCDGGRDVSVSNLVKCVGIALDLEPLRDCPECDTNQDGRVKVWELVRAVKAALDGCPDQSL